MGRHREHHRGRGGELDDKLLTKASYEISLGMLSIVATILFIGLRFVLQSPPYLLYRGDSEEARKVLETLIGNSLPPDELEVESVTMVKYTEEEKRTAEKIARICGRGPGEVL